MKTGLIVFLVGLGLILAGAVVFGFVYSQVQSNTKTLDLGPNETKSMSLTLDQGETYLITITSKNNVTFSYKIYAPNGTVIENDTNATSYVATINATAGGTYTLQITNLESTSTTIDVMVSSESDIFTMVKNALAAVALCCIGIIVIIIGIILLIIKK